MGNDEIHKTLGEFEIWPDLTTNYIVTALERLKIPRHHFFSVAIYPILFKLADNKDMHNTLNKFEFRPYRNIDY